MKNPSNEAWERLQTVIAFSGAKSINAFALSIGLSRSEQLYRIKRGKNGVSKALARRIKRYFPQVDSGWLICGGGVSVWQEFAQEKDYPVAVPLYDNFFDQETTRSIYLPEVLVKEVDRAVFLQQNHIYPLSRNGSVLFLKQAEADIVSGDIYFVHTDHLDALCEVKQVASSKRCHLTFVHQGEFVQIVVEREAIKGLYRICGIFIV